MSGHHHHGGHGHGHGRGRGGFYPSWVYELECDPSDPFYRECIARFGTEPAIGWDVFSGYADDMKAIRAYFDATAAATAEASKIKDTFIKWYDGISFATSANYDLARNQRNAFNLANVTTPEEKTAVQEVIAQGISSEQAQGDPDRRLANGMLPGPVTPPPPPLIPTPYLIGGAVAAAVAFVAWAYGEGRK